MAEDGKPEQSDGIEPPSTAMIIFIVLFVTLAFTFICSTLMQRIRRCRSTRRLVDLMTSRLRSRTADSDESRYPAARPSKYMKRFANVSVVNANAIVDEVHYERLREFPQSFAEVSEVGTNVESADFSQSEVATTAAASVYSRSGHRLNNSRSLGPQDREEGSFSSEPSRFGEHSYPGFPSLTMDPQEDRENPETERGGSRFHAVPPTANFENSYTVNSPYRVDWSAEAGETEAQPMSRMRTLQTHGNTAGVWRGGMKSNKVPYAFETSPVNGDAPGDFGRRVITNISVEDLAAHCAALQDEDEDESEEQDCRTQQQQRNGSLTATAAATASAIDGPRTAEMDEEALMHIPQPREGVTTPLTPYTYIMRQKAKMAQRGARSVVVVDPKPSSGSSVSDTVGSSEAEPFDTASDAVEEAESKNKEVVEAKQPRQHTQEAGPDSGEGDVVVAQHRPKRTVHREHHRHHTDKGGFIVCQDFVPDIASRRARRRQANAKKQKFVFQLRDEDAFYGRSEYLSRQPDADEERN